MPGTRYGRSDCSLPASYDLASRLPKNQHARAEMVDVRAYTCGHKGCSTIPSYGAAGSREREFCAQHARPGMTNVNLSENCGFQGCSRQPSHGVVGSMKRGVCAQHAGADVIHVSKKTCSQEGCSTRPSYGVAGSGRKELCAQHSRPGMVNMSCATCAHGGCLARPSYGVPGSGKWEFCVQHSKPGMTRVSSKTCGQEGCSTTPSYGVRGSGKKEFCAVHAKPGMANMSYRMCGQEDCSTRVPCGVKVLNNRTLCHQHASEVAGGSVGGRAQQDHTINGHLIGALSVQRSKPESHFIATRSRVNSEDKSSSKALSDGKQHGLTTSHTSGLLSVELVDVEKVTMKLELEVDHPPRSVGRARKRAAPAAPSKSNKDGGRSSSTSLSIKRHGRPLPAVVSGNSAGKSDLVSRKVKEEARVKCELSAPSLPL